MSLAGIPRITSGMALIEEARLSTLLLSIHCSGTAHAVLADLARRIAQDRPRDMHEAFTYLNKVQKEVNRVALSGPELTPEEFESMLQVVREQMHASTKAPTWHAHQIRHTRK